MIEESIRLVKEAEAGADRLAAEAKTESEENIRLAEEKAAQSVRDAKAQADGAVAQERTKAEQEGEVRAADAARELAELQQHMRIASAMKKETAVEAVIEAILAG